MDYRLYIDETGDHKPCRDGTALEGNRYLGLIGTILPRGEKYERFGVAVEDFKRRHLQYDPDEPPILHRTEIVNRRGVFGCLKDAEKCKAFDDDLISLLEKTTFTVIAVVIDKFTHGQKTYRSLSHPYHYCLVAMLERYCGLLKLHDRRGDVLVESRGGTEDQAFKRAYEEIYSDGGLYLSRSLAQARLTSKTPKLKKKELNIAGLQLADMLAHPLTRDVLVVNGLLPNRGGAFADRIAAVAKRMKYNRQQFTGWIKGYGRIFLD